MLLALAAAGAALAAEAAMRDDTPNDLKPGPGGSFPWEKAPAPDTLYDASAGIPGPGGSFTHEPAAPAATLYDPNAPRPAPGGRFGVTPGRSNKK